MVIEYIERIEGEDWAVARLMLPTGEPCPRRWLKILAGAFASNERALFVCRSVLAATFPELEPS